MKMGVKEIKRHNDGYIEAEVREGENYLSYFYNPLKGWVASFGIVYSREVKGDIGIRRRSWMGSGKGKISEKTWSKIDEMKEYFYNNSPKTY